MVISIYSYRLENLQSGVNYVVEVATRSDVLLDPLAVKTLDIPPFFLETPGPVTMLNTSVTQGSLNITWAPPLNSSSYHTLLQIRSYNVEIQLDGTMVILESFNISTQQVEYPIGIDLLPGTTYTVFVHANNDIGEGVQSSVNVTTLPNRELNHATLHLCPI